MRLFAFIVVLLAAINSHAQRKMPALTFLEGSVEFADGNKLFSDIGQLTDTLRDDHIVRALVKILKDNPNLNIELAGHNAGNEDSTFAQLRAERVRDILVENEIDSARIAPIGYGFRNPIITNEMLLGLNSRAERDEANQRNRRVEVKVVAIKPEY